MLQSRRFKWALLPAGLLVLGAVAACSEAGPSAPSTGTPSLAVQNLAAVVTQWEFVTLIGTANGVQDWGTSKVVANPGFGSLTLSTNNADTHVTTKGREDGLGTAERGAGICYWNGSVCSGDEIGDDHAASSPLFMDFSNVTPAGSTLTHIFLGSVQIDEGWKISYSSSGIGGPYTLLSQGSGNGSNNPNDQVDLLVSPALSTTNLVLKLEINDTPGLNGLNDYVVGAVTIETPSSEGCTFTQGYYKNHESVVVDLLTNSSPYITGGKLGITTGNSVSLTAAQIDANLETPPQHGDAYYILTHQLITAELNIIGGASAPASVTDAITAARALLVGGISAAERSSAINLAGTLDDYNNGLVGPGHCGIEEVGS